MLKYYFLFFMRNMRRQKLFSAINILGLTAGTVSTLVIYLYLHHEFNYDRFHSNADRIFRINQTFIWGDHDEHEFASLGPGVAEALKAEIPEVEAVTRIHPPGNFLVWDPTTAERKAIDEEGILAVDSNFLDVFTFPLLKGDKATALHQPYSIVITESAAKNYFGDADPLGKTLEMEYFERGKPTTSFLITGVMKDPPSNSYIDFEMLISMNSLVRVREAGWTWIWTTFETFVLLHPEASVAALEAKLPALPRKHAEATLQRLMNQSFDQYTQGGKKWELFVQPLTKIHLYSSNVYNRLNQVGSIKALYVLTGVEIFIILLSCINFMNLSTAQYARRVKESSLRKILGSTKIQLAWHFFSEAFMFCCLSAILAIGLVQLVLPVFNAISGMDLKLDLIGNQNILWVLIGLIVGMSLLSGSYPAVFLSMFPPAEALKGKIRAGKQGRRLRHGLVAFQFAISMILIVCTVVVFQQLKHLASKDIGFNRENLLVIDRLEWVGDKETFFNSIENIPGIEQATWCSAVPPNLYDGDQFTSEGNGETVSPLNFIKVDERYVPTLNLKMKVGRNFSKDIPADKDRIILNEAAVKSLGWLVDEKVLGKKIYYRDKTFEVVGIVGDFNYWTLQAPIQPMALFHMKGPMYYSQSQFMAARIKPGDLDSWNTMEAALEKSWRQHAGEVPFQYEFVDQAFDDAFKSEARFGKTLTVFAGLAIMIAGFGLLGMIVYTLEQRTKEIGIRKVVGASIMNIWVLVVKDYSLLIVVAAIISSPVCFWFLNKWLSEFQYRIEISPWVFVVSCFSILATALLLTSYHVLKAAATNPAEVLKDE